MFRSAQNQRQRDDKKINVGFLKSGGALGTENRPPKDVVLGKRNDCSATAVFACGMLQGWGLEG